MHLHLRNGLADLSPTGPDAFAQVVAQTRNLADTGLGVQGPVAAERMRIARCPAGGPEAPPPPGARFRAPRIVPTT